MREPATCAQDALGKRCLCAARGDGRPRTHVRSRKWCGDTHLEELLHSVLLHPGQGFGLDVSDHHRGGHRSPSPGSKHCDNNESFATLLRLQLSGRRCAIATVQATVREIQAASLRDERAIGHARGIGWPADCCSARMGEARAKRMRMRCPRATTRQATVHLPRVKPQLHRPTPHQIAFPPRNGMRCCRHATRATARCAAPARP